MSKQNWSTGETVKVGFMTLKVTGQMTKEYYRPWAYVLEASKGQKYLFTPYYGLEKL